MVASGSPVGFQQVGWNAGGGNSEPAPVIGCDRRFFQGLMQICGWSFEFCRKLTRLFG